MKHYRAAKIHNSAWHLKISLQGKRAHMSDCLKDMNDD